MTALATRPDRRIVAGETPDSTMMHSYPTEREVHIAAAARVRDAVPDRADQIEILKALFADGDTLRKRAAEAQARAKGRSAPVKPAVRKPTAPPTVPMVPIGPARKHVLDLTSRGMRQQAISRVSGASESAVSMLVRGAYKKGDPPRQEITAELEARILSVEFVAPPTRTPKPKAPKKSKTAGQGKCRSAAEFKLAGDRVGQCLACGEVAPLYRGRLTGHKTRQVTGGAP